MEILPRSAWAGAEPPRPPPRLGTVRYAVIHHTALAAGERPGDVPGLIRALRDLHVEDNGWDDLGYNLLVDRFGRAWEGRAGGVEAAVVGAHARGHNAVSTGIALIGDWSERLPPEVAVRALRELVTHKLRAHGLAPSPATVVPHGALADTACPGAVPIAALR